MSNCSIRPIDRTQSGTTTSGQIEPGNNDNEGVLHILHSCKTEALKSDCLEHSLKWRSYPAAEMQSVYSTAPPPQ